MLVMSAMLTYIPFKQKKQETKAKTPPTPQWKYPVNSGKVQRKKKKKVLIMVTTHKVEYLPVSGRLVDSQQLSCKTPRPYPHILLDM